jgi:hypothetical protein
MVFESYKIKLFSEIDFFQVKFHEMKILTTLV